MVKRVDPGLDRKKLTDAAFALLEADGLDKFSMRRLAARVGVQASAFYWHIGEKDELLGLMAAEIYRAADLAAPDDGDWRRWLIGFGHSLRQAFAEHRDGAMLCARARPRPTATAADSAMNIAKPLVDRGIDPARALTLKAAVIAFTLGWAVFEANGPMHDFLESMFDFRDSFDKGLTALVAGF